MAFVVGFAVAAALVGSVGLQPSGLEAQNPSPLTIQPSTGRVGIGTTTPSTTLDVNGEVSASSFRGDGSRLTGLSSRGPWSSNGSGIHYDTGFVGLGTSEPAGPLHIQVSNIPPETMLQEAQLAASGTSAGWMNQDSGGRISAQRITPRTNYSVVQADLPLIRYSGVTGSFWLTVETDAGALPSGEVLGTSSAIAATGISTTKVNWFAFTFPTPVPLSAGTPYWFVLRGNSTYTGANKLQRRDNNVATGTPLATMNLYMDNVANPTTWKTHTKEFAFKLSSNRSPVGTGLIVTDTGRVGIGTASPRSALEVAGPVTGIDKRFQIDHPMDPTNKYLVHSAIEGPETAVYYRGVATFPASTTGSLSIALPPYFEALTRTDGRTAQITGVGGSCNAWVVAISGGVLTVDTVPDLEMQAFPGCRTFYWEVKAMRADVEPLVVEPDKSAL